MRILQVVGTIWIREMLRFYRQRSRLVGMFVQPLLYLGLVGVGISNAMSFRGAPPGVNYLQFMFPGILGMSVLFTSMFGGMSIIWDREFGFLKEVLVAPVPRWAVAVGKVLGIATQAMIQTLILLLLTLIPSLNVSFTFMGVLKTLLAAFLISCTIGSFGIAIASRLESMEGFQMVSNFLLMPMFFLSGAMYPLNNLPAWMAALTKIDPLTYGVDALRAIAYERTEAAKFLVQFNLGLDLAVLVVLAALLTSTGAWSFSKTE